MHYALAIDAITLYSKIDLMRPGAANFADIIKTTKLIKATFKKLKQPQIICISQ